MILKGCVEGVEQEDVDCAVGWRGGPVGEGAGRHRWYGLEFGGGLSGVFLEVLDLLGIFVFEECEVGGFEVVDGVLVGVGDDDVYDDELGVGFEGGYGLRGWGFGRGLRGRGRVGAGGSAAFVLRVRAYCNTGGGGCRGKLQCPSSQR